MTDFVRQFATVVGNPRYPQKSFDGIHYLVGTRVYRVHTIKKHLCRRKIKCVYTSQPEYQDFLERKKAETRHVNNSESETESNENNNDDNTNKTVDNNQPEQQTKNTEENDSQNLNTETTNNNNEETTEQPQVQNLDNNNQNHQINHRAKL